MIAPTTRMIVLVAAAAPVALLVALVNPAWWIVAPLWIALIFALFVADALLAAAPANVEVAVSSPSVVGVGEPFDIAVDVAGVAGGYRRDATAALALDPLISEDGRADAKMQPSGRGDGVATAVFALVGARRGPGAIEKLWLSWSGVFGLARRMAEHAVNRTVAVAPSMRAVNEEGAQLFARDAQVGQRLRARLGEGSEFESLVRFMPGLDRRAIDWKQSARHTDLLAKQFETERDNRIVLAIDCGRMMSDPMPDADGGEAVSRLDRCISAAMALAYVGLKLEDRVSLFAFAGKPTISSREFTRSGEFAALRRTAAEIDYSDSETNYTLGLATLGARLKRRALVLVFTEFADAAGAELMIAAARRLVDKHLLCFVVLADSELERSATQLPETAEALATAAISADLLRDRQIVLARLRRMGAMVVEAPAAGLTSRLLNTYVGIKRRGAI